MADGTFKSIEEAGAAWGAAWLRRKADEAEVRQRLEDALRLMAGRPLNDETRREAIELASSVLADVGQVAVDVGWVGGELLILAQAQAQSQPAAHPEWWYEARRGCAFWVRGPVVPAAGSGPGRSGADVGALPDRAQLGHREGDERRRQAPPAKPSGPVIRYSEED